MRSPWHWAAAIGLLVTMVVGTVALSARPPGTVEATRASSDTTVAATTTAPVPQTTATTAPATTSTTTAEQRLEEVRAIVQDLWYRWFDAIYRKDESVLWSIVANSERYESALDAMDDPQFPSAPTREGVELSVVEILLDRADCLVVYSALDVTAFGGTSAATSVVEVLWSDERYGWRRASLWRHKGDVWINDCDLMERETTP